MICSGRIFSTADGEEAAGYRKQTQDSVKDTGIRQMRRKTAFFLSYPSAYYPVP